MARAQWHGHDGSGSMSSAQARRQGHDGIGMMARSQARFHGHDGTGTGTIVRHDVTGAVAQSQGGVGLLPIDISEQMMPMLSL